MIDKKDLMPLNDKGQRHGYHEIHFNDGGLSYKCTYDNGTMIGYFEDHFPPDTTDVGKYMIDKTYFIR